MEVTFLSFPSLWKRMDKYTPLHTADQQHDSFCFILHLQDCTGLPLWQSGAVFLCDESPGSEMLFYVR